MTQNKVYGLTGGSGSGKSTAAAIFQKRGANIIDADKIAREIMQPPSAVLTEILRVFGADVLLADGTLDRKKLGRIVFSDSDKLRVLNEITHPEITKRALSQIQPDKLNIIDAAVLFECARMVAICEKIIVVCADKNVRIDRICKRDGISKKDAENRINAQVSQEQLVKKADFVIHNNSDIAALERGVFEVLNWQ